jgi:hypothetical protein
MKILLILSKKISVFVGTHGRASPHFFVAIREFSWLEENFFVIICENSWIKIVIRISPVVIFFSSVLSKIEIA